MIVTHWRHPRRYEELTMEGTPSETRKEAAKIMRVRAGELTGVEGKMTKKQLAACKEWEE